jgi:hypothetical protein
VVFDMQELPSSDLIPDNCEVFLHKNPHSTAGHAQRNFTLNLIKEGHIYSNDDDTVIYPELWNNIKDLNNDFISFDQNNKDGSFRIKGDIIKQNHIDNHNFIFSYEILGNSRFIPHEYGGDGIFAAEIYSKAQSPVYIEKVLSIYNALR